MDKIFLHSKRPFLFFLTLLLGAPLPAAAAPGARSIYQWVDRQGIDNWADKNPLTDPGRRLPLALQPPGQRRRPAADPADLGRQLQDYGSRTIPALCLARNRDNPAQRSTCVALQMRALARIDAFVNDPSNGNALIIYERCHRKWRHKDGSDFVYFAQCVGVEP